MLGRAHIHLLLAGLLALSAGCGTMSNGRRWGETATVRPGWSHVGRSAWAAVRDPQVWGPLLAAGLLQIDDADRELSDWAVEHTPIFGSPEEAEDAVGWTGEVLDDALYATMLLTPSGDDPGEWALSKLGGAAVEFAGVFASDQSVNVLKDATGRTRPNEKNDKSFPSSHATRSSVDVTLACRNLDATPMPDGVRATAKTGLYGVGIVSAWSRVEAEGHYPSDVLAGWALGRFWGAFTYDAFLPEARPPFALELAPDRGGARVGLRFSF